MRRLRRAYQRHARQEAKRRKKFRRRAIAAGTAAAITLGAGVSLTKALAAYTPDPHELPVSQDTDADLLADSEEAALAYLDFNADQNRNAIPDGVELAKQGFIDINDLPIWDPFSGNPEPNQPYKKIIAAAYGIEPCAICGEYVVMIKWEVVNPNNHCSAQLTDMGMHFLEHGSFSYHSLDGWSGEGRLDVPTLLQALELRLPCEPNDHQLPIPEDADADLLSNRDELAIGYRVFKPDQNRNGIPDGVELAERCAEVIDQLPQIDSNDPPPNETYKVEHQARGNENCRICGVPINMGTMEIVSPQLGLRVEFPILSLHYMGHGSFSYDGTTNTGRTDVPLLMRTLELRFPYDPNAHQLPVDASDLDEDFLADSEELKAGFNLHDPDQDQDLTPDGIELAKRCAAVINQLPWPNEVTDPNETYKWGGVQLGLQACDICGELMGMGPGGIVNPRLGINVECNIYMAIHYMSHGSFSYSGDAGAGRIDVPALMKVLEMPQQCGDLGTLYLPGDLNKDCKVDFADFGKFADKWLDSTEPGQD